MDDVLQEKDIFFVFGVAKSGTTWLQLLLNEHPQIYCRGEDNFGFFVDRLNQLFTDYNTLINLMNKQTSNDKELDFLENQDAESIFRQVVLTALSKGRKKQEVVKLGTKDNCIIRNPALFAHLFPGAKFIHIIRDPRDIAVSSWFDHMRVEEDFVEREKNINQWAKKASDWWYQSIKGVEACWHEDSQAVFHIRYEDMLEDGIRLLGNICDFLEVDSSKTTVEQCLEANSFAKRSGGRKTGDEDQTSFYRKGQAGDWTNHIDAKTVEDFSAEAKLLMNSYNYQ